MSGWHLVLLGDSIFDNRAYVKAGHSVSEHLQALMGTAGKVTLLAVDGHLAGDVTGQLLAMPEGATHIALSVGGNDALESLPALETGCSSVLQALEILGKLQRAFANSYRSALLAALKPGLPLIACTIYDAVPGLPPPLKTALSLFNDVICRNALAHQVPVLDLSDLLPDPGDYSTASPIEPSEMGGKKIAQALQSWFLIEHRVQAAYGQ